ncbi:MAG: hypothetical protein KDB79_04030 [Acidobacteria bacterium]|nr:hypothetical protein [Acidobacteriota bacterium]
MKREGARNKAIRKLSDAVNTAVDGSPDVIEAIEELRTLGFEPNLNLVLEIGLSEIRTGTDGEKFQEEISLELSEDDLRELRRMKISAN